MNQRTLPKETKKRISPQWCSGVPAREYPIRDGRGAIIGYRIVRQAVSGEWIEVPEEEYREQLRAEAEAARWPLFDRE